MTNISNKTKAANIVLSNLDTLTENTLAYFINSNLCTNARLALSPKNINIYIIDLDKNFDEEIFNNIELHKQYVIGIYINDHQKYESDRIVLVKKPLNVTELKSAIDKVHSLLFEPVSKLKVESSVKIEKKIKHIDQVHRNLYNAIDDENIEDDIHLRYKAQRYVGNNKDVDPNQADLNLIYINTESYFFSFLIKGINMAKDNKTNSAIKTSLGLIVYQRNSHTLHHNIDSNKLKLLQTSPLISPVTISLTNSTFNQLEEVLDASKFVWDTCIKTSKGRLPELTNLMNPVKMQVWPNFSQLKIFRHAIPIAAVWSRQQIGLIETAKLLEIPQRYVFSLYCVMNSLGFAHVVDFQYNSTKSDKNNDLQTKKPSRLFRKILSHIFKSK